VVVVEACHQRWQQQGGGYGQHGQHQDPAQARQAALQEQEGRMSEGSTHGCCGFIHVDE
jgi:hypothetical protein